MAVVEMCIRDRPMFTVPQGGYPPQNVGQQHPHYPQGEIPMFPQDVYKRQS